MLLVVNVGSLEKRSNQPKYKEPRTRSPKTTTKLIQNNVYWNIVMFKKQYTLFWISFAVVSGLLVLGSFLYRGMTTKFVTTTEETSL